MCAQLNEMMCICQQSEYLERKLAHVLERRGPQRIFSANFKFKHVIERDSCVVVTASRSSSVNVFPFGKKLDTVSLDLGVQMGTGYIPLGVTLRWTGIPSRGK